ncbi:630_t:CDS:2 [Funneliformis geosporum]|uniref:630_t:CDS:1 n=1 Tax=Funneliformis geosporum TaxID=1117311 RepID=A0A9W4WP50_9GLOM|nr:630_t:CDS:2 [Funneliformis geosporum]
MKLIHRDFHSGNILQDISIDGTIKTFVADLGLCRPVNRTLKSISEERDVYGVLSYIAPEILRRTHDYSEASDIYGFGMLMWEVLHDKPPFHNVPHDVLLALDICKGVRPKMERRAPKWYINLMINCWDSDPSKRPEILEIRKTIQSRYCDALDRDLAAEYLLTGNINNGFSQTSHPEAIFASRLLNFSNLPDSGEVLDISEYSSYFCDDEQQVEDETNKEVDYITRAFDESLSFVEFLSGKLKKAFGPSVTEQK